MHAIYPPLDTLKPVAENLWVVDGPVIAFGPAIFKMPFPTRMTVIRLPADNLFIHSPTRLTPALRAEIERTGIARWIIGPNRLHYGWVPDWKTAFPAADVYLAPRIIDQARGRIDFDWQPLDRSDGYPWDGEIATMLAVGSYMTEVVFFHRASRTLVLTDLIENFEPHKMGFLMRWLARFGGVLDPSGGMPRDMRLTFRGRKSQLRGLVDQMIALDPERIILAHGRWYQAHGAVELRRAFRWLTRGS